jgi:hypothetical protein
MTVHVEDAGQPGQPGARLVTFAAYWDGNASTPPQAVTGSFVVPPV